MIPKMKIIKLIRPLQLIVYYSNSFSYSSINVLVVTPFVGFPSWYKPLLFGSKALLKHWKAELLELGLTVAFAKCRLLC